MLKRYELTLDVYECPGLECRDHDCGHSIRAGMTCNVSAESPHLAKRRAIINAHLTGLMVKAITIVKTRSLP